MSGRFKRNSKLISKTTMMKGIRSSMRGRGCAMKKTYQRLFILRRNRRESLKRILILELKLRD